MCSKSSDELPPSDHRMVLPDEEAAAVDGSSLFPGFRDYNEFSQAALRALMLATRNSNALPSEGDDFDYYSSFSSVRQVFDIQGSRILSMVQDMMRYYGARGNLSTSCELTDIDDRFEVLVDANDQLLERVGTLLDEASGLKKDVPLIVVTKTPKLSPGNNWNKREMSGSVRSKGIGFKLMTAKNIVRPQLSFRDKVDNANRPFVPKITSKPNALKSLEDSMVCDGPEDGGDFDPSFTYPHPYQFELDHFTPSAQQLGKCEPKPPSSVDTPPIYIDTEDGLKKLCLNLKEESEIAIDLENHSFRSFQGFTCLMQLSTRSQDFIVDTLKLRHDMYVLNEVFTDQNIVKVLHGADLDVVWLQRDFGLYLVNMFDTGQAARLLLFPKFSLAYLLDRYCGVIADKQYQVADWRIRPLPQELLKYARDDTHYLLYIYDRLRAELSAQDRGTNQLLSAVVTRSTQLCAKKYCKPRFTDGCHKELHRQSKKVFNSKQMEALRRLYTWRDQLARQEDESTGYVLPNHMLLQMAEILPKETGGVLACCNPLPPLVRQNVCDLHSIIKETREKPLIQAEAAKAQLRPTAYQHPKYSFDLLTCLHDLSWTDQTSNKFFDSASDVMAVVVSEKSLPALSGMGCHLKMEPREAEARRRAIQTAASFVNPFEKYLPEVLIKEGAVRNCKASDVWKLLPNTSQPAAVKQIPAVQVIKTGAHLNFSICADDVEQQIAALRQKVSEEKKVAQDATPAAAGVAPEEPDGVPAAEQPVKKKKKRKNEDSLAQVNESTFRAFDYKAASQQERMQGEPSKKSSKGEKKKKKKAEFDANDASAAEPDFKPASKAHFSKSTNNKSLTYGGKGSEASRTPKIQWPSR